MALGARICKVELQVSDLDRHYYASHALTLAQHPSETDERLMVRLLAFALFAAERLEFTRGLCADDEPELWLKGLDGTVELWLELGQPDERRLRKACGRARRVVVLCYGGRAAELWWEQNRAVLERHANLEVLNLPRAQAQALAAWAGRSLQLDCTVDGGVAWLSRDGTTLELTPERWRG